MSEIKVSLFRRERCKFIQMQYRDPETGRKVCKSSEKTDERGALRAAARWEKEVNEDGDLRRNGRLAWEKFRERYENEVLPGLAEATHKKSWGVLNVFEREMKPRRLCDISSDMLSRYQKKLREQGKSENTIKGHLAHLRSALSWAVSVNLLRAVPAMPNVQRAKASKLMKGRPITLEEFERMLEKVGAVVELDEPGVESWRFFLRGLWASGLRLAEALELSWTDDSKLCVDLSLRHPMLRFPAELEKGNKDRLLPMAPEFAEFLASVPAGQRHGYVFKPKAQRERNGRLGEQQVGRVVSAIGEKAGVIVAPQRGTAATEDQPASDDYKPAKYASAHDLRRSFGERWASKVMPQVLMELMRHESIETTMKFYVGRNAQTTASVLWAAVAQDVSSAGTTQLLSTQDGPAGEAFSKPR